LQRDGGCCDRNCLDVGYSVRRELAIQQSRHYFIADDYVENLFSTIAPNGLLLTQDWQVASPMLYAQEIEQRRPDVKVVESRH
jgi:hypothetical protein